MKIAIINLGNHYRSRCWQRANRFSQTEDVYTMRSSVIRGEVYSSEGTKGCWMSYDWQTSDRASS